MMYGLALSLKNEIVKIAPRGRVNCVAPGMLVFSVGSDRMDRLLVAHLSFAGMVTPDARDLTCI